ARVHAERGALTIDFVVTGIAGIERALAIADAGDESATSFLAKNVAVGAPRAMESVFDGAGETDRDLAEEAVTGLQHLVPGEGALVLGLRRHIAGAGLALRRRLVWPARAATVLSLRRGRRPRGALEPRRAAGMGPRRAHQR